MQILNIIIFIVFVFINIISQALAKAQGCMSAHEGELNEGERRFCFRFH